MTAAQSHRNCCTRPKAAAHSARPSVVYIKARKNQPTRPVNGSIRKRGEPILKHYDKPLTAKEITALPDEAIDYSDIPELDDEFWQEAQWIFPEAKARITLRLDKEIVDYFRQGGGMAIKPASMPFCVPMWRHNAA
jgi:uncharacterized protein (DUF4415 family)